jgi:hypothetical protein
MESLETKIERLPPELQKEVENFIDFLVAKQSHGRPAPEPPAVMQEVDVPSDLSFMSSPSQPGQRNVPHAGPVILTEEQRRPGHDDWVTRNYLDYGAFEDKPPEQHGKKRRRESRSQSGHPREILDWIE